MPSSLNGSPATPRLPNEESRCQEAACAPGPSIPAASPTTATVMASRLLSLHAGITLPRLAPDPGRMSDDRTPVPQRRESTTTGISRSVLAW